MKFVVVDYHKGNIRSVERGLAAVGADVLVSDAPSDVLAAGAIVLPGVGAFTDAMQTLEALGLAEVIREAVCGRGVSFLGICLGQHLMYDAGCEHAAEGSLTPGLGLLPGVVRAMPKVDSSGLKFKVPHVGWNSVRYAEGCPLFSGIAQDEHFYFTHSFIAPESEFTVGKTVHSVVFPSAVQRGLAFGVQFHPEKSSMAGARMLANFVEYSRRGS